MHQLNTGVPITSSEYGAEFQLQIAWMYKALRKETLVVELLTRK